MTRYLLLVSTFIVFFSGCSTASNGDVEVKIPQGRLLGEWRKSFGGRAYAAFEGVPFARPPVGKGRFREPQPPKPWQGVWIAKNLSKECIQWYDIRIGKNDDKIMGSEDCLYLNVYTPNPRATTKLPVIVYIHGGAFMFGSGIQYGGDFLMDRDVVYVSINYRLGPMGFLSTQDDVVPGNNGLKDQVMALKWVKENIQYFGGNPKSVTAMGMSAGGASVNYHLLSPLSKGLIHRGISESGTSCCPWTLQSKPAEKAATIGRLLGCPTDSTKDMIDCLRHRPAAAIVRTVPYFIPFIHSPFSPFAPVIEPANTKDAFITKHPYQVILNGEAEDIPWMTSLTTHEGLYPAALFVQRSVDLDELESRWEELVPFVFDFNDTLPASKHMEAAEKIKLYYLKGHPLSKDNFAGLIDALSDRHFVIDVEKCARLHASFSKQPVYHYQFAYSGQQSLGKRLSTSKNNYGISHGDDTGYIIKTDYMDSTTTSDDRKMIAFMVNLAVEFAKNGVPKAGNIEWPQINAREDEITYLQIKGPNKCSIKTKKSLGPVDFWDSLGLNENENYHSHCRDEL